MKMPDIDKISLRIESMWLEAENRIMEDVVRRIKTYGKITPTADYQIKRLIELGKTTEEVEQHIQKAINGTNAEMYKLYDDVVNWEYVRNSDIYEQINNRFIPPEDNYFLKTMSRAIKEQTRDELQNLSQSYGFSVSMNGKRAFMPFATYYQKYVDSAIMDVLGGGFDYNTVIRRTVTQMANSGLRTVDYASGYSRRANVAARSSVLTGVNQITRRINEQVAEDLGTDKFEITWHSGHRPDHWWGGMVLSMSDLIKRCGLGSGPGLCGWNCYHAYYAFVEGASVRTYSDAQLAELEAQEQRTQIWHGEEYTVYEIKQKQRSMETTMRAQRSKINLMKQADVDYDIVLQYRAKYQNQLAEYTAYCKKMGQEQQRERIYADMLGRIA